MSFSNRVTRCLRSEEFSLVIVGVCSASCRWIVYLTRRPLLVKTSNLMRRSMPGVDSTRVADRADPQKWSLAT